ncbi:hypothetical protein DL767_000197 [Monosporascus sp. MG133]|nr:hypothetical protein DL767_000197 [Monosporascus sp. MG133]
MRSRAYDHRSSSTNPRITTAEGWAPLYCLGAYFNTYEDGEAAQLASESISRVSDVEARATVLTRDWRSRVGPAIQSELFGSMPWGFRLHESIQRVAEKIGTLKRDLAPLHWAAEHGAVGAAKVLLARGANPSTRDEAESPPARAALESEFLRCNQEVSDELSQRITGHGGDTGARGA